MNDLNFELFTRPSTRRPSRGALPIVTLSEKGLWHISAEARRLLQQPTHVQMLYDRTRRAVGFRACESTAQGAYRISKSGYVRAIHFCAAYNIALTNHGFEPHLEKDILVIQL